MYVCPLGVCLLLTGMIITDTTVQALSRSSCTFWPALCLSLSLSTLNSFNCELLLLLLLLQLQKLLYLSASTIYSCSSKQLPQQRWLQSGYNNNNNSCCRSRWFCYQLCYGRRRRWRWRRCCCRCRCHRHRLHCSSSSMSSAFCFVFVCISIWVCVWVWMFVWLYLPYSKNVKLFLFIVQFTLFIVLCAQFCLLPYGRAVNLSLIHFFIAKWNVFSPLI